MKAVVVKEYADKVTGELHHIGDAVTLTPERYEEIKKAGRFVIPVKPAPVSVEKKRRNRKA